MRTPFFLLSLLLAALLLVAAACGGPSEEPEPTSAPAVGEGSGGEATAVPAATPTAMAGDGDNVSGGTLLRLWGDPPTLDPHLAGDTTSAGIIVEVFGGLATIDVNLKIAPDLAERWDVSSDGTTYTFHLRDGIKFHDGKAVTARDVKWSIERITDPATQAPTADVFLGDIVGAREKLEGSAQEVSGVKVIDDRTISFTADGPKAYFLAKLTYPTSFALDQANVEGAANWLDQPNGTGPFRLAEYTLGEVIRLEANKDYHLGAPYLDEVVFRLSGGDAMLQYQNDEIHLTGVGLDSLDSILDPTNPLSNDVQRSPPSFSTYYMGMNVEQPPFDDTNIRLALNHAIDREAIAREILRGLLVPAKGVLPPNFPGYDKNIPGYNFDPIRAKTLLDESKYGEGKEELPRITMAMPGSFGASVGPSTEAILGMWRDNLGIEVEIVHAEWATYLQDLHTGRYQMFGGSGWIADYPDPENFLDVLLHSESSDNHTNYSNPEFDRLVEQARTEQDRDTRFDLYNQAERMAVADAPWIPLWHGDSGYVLIKPYLKGYHLLPMTLPKLRHVYLEPH